MNETKDNLAVVTQEKVKAGFHNFLEKKYDFIRYEAYYRFYELPFDMQQGGYTAYLRSKGIEAYALPVADKKYWAITEFYNAESDFVQFDKVCDDHDTALISAINEGLRIVEEQLNKISNETKAT